MRDYCRINDVDFYVSNNVVYVRLSDLCLKFNRDINKNKQDLNKVTALLKELNIYNEVKEKNGFIGEDKLFLFLFNKHFNNVAEYNNKIGKSDIPISLKLCSIYREFVEELIPLLRKRDENVEYELSKAYTDIKHLKRVNKQQEKTINNMKDLAHYANKIINNNSLLTVTSIAKDYGMTAREFNKLLQDLKIQYKQDEQWFLYSKYHNLGYTYSHSQYSKYKDTIKSVTKWTQKGKYFLYNELKKHDILPTIERDMFINKTNDNLLEIVA